MLDLDYTEAHKLAMRQYRRAKARGESPYPACLDEILSPLQMAEGKRLGREQIPLALVVGTKHEGRNHAFSRGFMPLLGSESEFASKWISLCQSHLEVGIRDPIQVYEYKNRFYVEEGNKRVSVLKYFDADSVDAYVIQIPPQRMADPAEGLREEELYQAFQKFYQSSHLRTVEFSRPESFRRLQELVGKIPAAGDIMDGGGTADDEKAMNGPQDAWPVWTVDEQREFKSMYYYFHREYTKAGGNGHLPWVCDALLRFIEWYGYEEVCQMYSDEIRSAVREHGEELGVRPSVSEQTVQVMKGLPAATLSGGKRIAVRSGKTIVQGSRQVVRSGKSLARGGKQVVCSGGKVVQAGKRLAGSVHLEEKLIAAAGSLASQDETGTRLQGSLALTPEQPGRRQHGFARLQDIVLLGPEDPSAGSIEASHPGGSSEGSPGRRRFRILALADDECREYYEDYRDGNLDGFDLILSCGDLHRTYLEFLTTMAKCPVFYVRGNHDDQLLEEPPGGCVCIEDQVYVHEGLRIVGLGGSFRYRDGKNMFTEEQMRKRARKLTRKLRKSGGFDILMTHAPARGINDFDSLSHRGFETFRQMLEMYRPQYFVHGHIHKNYGIRIPQKTRWNGTTVINAYGHCVFEIEI